MKKTLLLFLVSFLLKNATAQFSFTCSKDTTIGCSQSCITLQTKIPDIHAYSSDYGVNSLSSGPGGCFRPPVNPAIPGVSTNLSTDDRYTPIIPLPFIFTHYGIYYQYCSVNTNGIISFDLTNSGPDNLGTGAQWIIQGLDGSLPSTDYDRAIIMGAFHDIDISRPESPTRQIKYDVIGTAPHRKWILSFYKVPCFDCNSKINNTYQITLYEGLSLVEVHVFGREVCTTWNAGAAMIGMQDYDRTHGIMAPGRSAFTTPRWQGTNMNEAWRFTPKDGPTLFKNVILTDLGGNFVANGNVSAGGSNELSVTFPNICPTATTTYLVKSAYYNQEYPFQFPAADSLIYGVDTITVYKNGSIPAMNVTTTPAVCGPNPNGTITVNSPVGPNYEYSIDGGTTYQPGNGFTVLPGTYTVTVHDITGTCTKDTTVTVNSPATFTATATSTNTSCPNVANGVITVTPSVAGVYTYDIDNSGNFSTSNVIDSVSAGSHNIAVKDAAGCAFGFPYTVLSDPGFSTTASSVNASCAGLPNGSISVNAPSSGQVPFTYAIGTNSQGTTSFTGLAGDSTYTIIVTDNIGCADTLTQRVVNNPAVTANVSTLSASCIGINDGSITITPAGGTSPYSFDSTGTGSFASLPASLTGLASGTYNITIKDNVGCKFTPAAITVNAGTGVRASTFPVNSACTDATTGKIRFTITNGTGPFTYTLNSGSPQNLASTTDSALNLAPGNYAVRVTDSRGCFLVLPPVSVGANDPGVAASFVTKATACADVTTGQIVIQPVAGVGVGPYSYNLDNTGFVLLTDTLRNLDSGFHHVVFKDALGCNISFDPEILIGPGVNATDSVIQSACTEALTGKIFVKVSSGIAPFQFSKDSGATWQANIDSFVSLAPGTYHIAVKDNVGCTYHFNSTVGAGAGITATDSVILSDCITASTGKIFVKPSTNAILPIQFSKDSGITWQTSIDSFINLTPGTYHIAVKDALGCSYHFNSTVGAGPGITATDSTVVSNCAAVSTGKIFVRNVTGVAPFQFSKDSGITWQANIDSFTALAPGVYRVAVKDAVGCIYHLNSTVGIGNGVSGTDSTVAANCATARTGKIYIKPGFGTPPFKYSNDSGANFQNSNAFLNLLPATYNIAITDAVGCEYFFSSTVAAGIGVTATDSTVVSECATATTGKIFVRTSTGIAPFQFSKDSGRTWQASIDSFVNLAPGNYNIAVKDAVGCVSYLVSAVGTGTGVSGTAVSINSACLGVSTGKIALTVNDGTAPFTYTINSGSPVAVDTIRNLASGSYNIVLNDAVGCSFAVPAVTVNNDIGVTATFTPVKTACAAANTGAVIVKPLSGTRPFTYSLDGGTTTQADSVFRKLVVNTYTIQVKDAVGCILNSSVQNVTAEPGILNNASTIQNASCESIPNGSIAVNITAGVAPLTYQLVSPVSGAIQNSNQFGTLFPGSYDVLVTDSAGCTKTITSVVGSNPKVKFDSINITSPTCQGLLNGIITVNVSQGVSPYQYALDNNAAWGTVKSFSTVGAGTHRLYVKDANGCAIDSSVTVTEPALLRNAVTSTGKATCSGNPDGKIEVSATGGTTPYRYTLDATGLSGYQSAGSFDVLKGNYSITAMDANGCTAVATAVVDSVFTMYLGLGPDTTLCAGSALVLSPVTNPETNIFSYSPAASLDQSNIKNPSATPADTTTYTLTAQWGICKLTDNIKVNVLRKPIADAGSDVVICHDSIAVLRASARNLSGTVNFLWSPSSLLETKADTTVVTVRPKDEDTYFTVTVTDNYNCNFAVTDSVLVKMLPKVYAFAGNDTNAVLEKPHQLRASGAGVGGTYVWTAPAGVTLSDYGIATPTAIFMPVPGVGYYSPIDTNYYVLKVVATDMAGCSATDEIKINVFIGPDMYVPTAFSPNGDGINDIFKPIPVGINIEYFRVFNRYGEAVYETSGYMQGWDGVYKGKPQLNGAYVWVFKGKDKNGREVVRKGTVMLIR